MSRRWFLIIFALLVPPIAGGAMQRAAQGAEEQVRVFGDTAIVAGGAGMRVINKGVPAQIRIRYTNTQIRRDYLSKTQRRSNGTQERLRGS